MFLPREKKILSLLLKNETKFTTSQIAAELKVSPRTIKTDIKKINEELEKHSCYIRTKQGVGLWLDYDTEGEQFLKTALYEEQDSYISSEVRKYYIAAKLLNNVEYTSMEAMSNTFFVSKGTVVNDLNELEDFWRKFGITFTKKVKYGVKAEGSERQIRLALVDALKKAAGRPGNAALEKIQPLFEHVDLGSLREIVKGTEKRFHFVLTDISFDEFLLQLAVMLQRIQISCLIENEGDISSNVERKEWFVSQFLKEQIAEYLQIEMPKEEVSYLITCLQGMRFLIPMRKENDKVKLRSRAPEMFDFMMDILRQLDEKYHLDLEDDDELACAMFDHLECMVHRIQSKMYLANPILESVKKEMFYEYEIASYLIAKFNSRYGIEATEDEIGYITFHIGASIERMAQKNKRNLSATIVCMTGVGTAQFISMKLKRVFPNLEIKRIVSGNMAEGLTKEDQDFVISTIPLYLDGIDVIQVLPVLNEEDIRRVQKYIHKKENRQDEERCVYSYLKGFLHEEISILNCDLKSKEEVIELLGGRMCREGYVDEGYVASIFEREKLSDTSIGSLIAIPHAFEGHIRKQGIGLLTLQRPITWGNEKVQIVFMLALNANVDNHFQGIFGEILDLTRNLKDTEQVLKARKFHEIEIFKKS